VRCQTFFTRVNNQVPEGSQVLWMEVTSSFRGRERENGEGLRDDFVSEAREEKDGDFGYGGEEGIGCPDLMAEVD
jgi:hypothetical protein